MITFTYSSFGKTAGSCASPLGYEAGSPSPVRARDRACPRRSGGDATGQFCSFFSRLRIHRISASMNASISPSRTPEVLPVSAPVRTSFTLW